MKTILLLCAFWCSVSFGVNLALLGQAEVTVTTLAPAPVQFIPEDWKINFSHQIGHECKWVHYLQWDLADNIAPFLTVNAYTWHLSFYEGFFANNVYGEDFYCHQGDVDTLRNQAFQEREARHVRPYALVPENKNVIYSFSLDGDWVANAQQNGHEVKLFYTPWGRTEQASLTLDNYTNGGVMSLAFMEYPDETLLVVIAGLLTSVYKIVLSLPH